MVICIYASRLHHQSLKRKFWEWLEEKEWEVTGWGEMEFKTFVLDNANYVYLGFGYTLKNEVLYKHFENYLN